MRKKKYTTAYLAKWPYIFFAPFFIMYLVFFMFPTGYSFYISLNKWNIGYPIEFIGFDNYRRMLTNDTYFETSVYNTLIITFFALPLLIVIGLFMAELLFDERMKFRSFFQTANYLPYITTPIAVAIIFSLMFDQKVGVVNILLVQLGILKEPLNWLVAPNHMQWAMLIAMMIWQRTGYYLVMYLAGMTAIPGELYEAARIDGANRVQVFFKITVPLLRNITTFLTVTSVVALLQLFDAPWLLQKGLNQDRLPTIEKPLMTVMTNFYEQSIRNGRMGYGAAVTYALFVIIMFLIAFVYLLMWGMGKIREKRGAYKA